MVYRYCWHNYMVWGGNRYVEIFVGGGGKPKKGPPNGKKTADSPPPPHGKKCSQYREKCSKSHPH